MLPIDSADGQPWTTDNAALLLRQVKCGVLSDLGKRTERRTGGRCNAANGYSALVLDADGHLVGDQTLARLCHSTHEVRILVRSRFYKMLEKPLDQRLLAGELRERERQIAQAESELAAAAIERTLAGEESPGVQAMQTAVEAAEEIEASLRDDAIELPMADSPVRIGEPVPVGPVTRRGPGRPIGSRNRVR